MKQTHSQGATQIPSATNARNFRTFLLVRQFAQKEIGQRIALARKEAGGMTQEQLAELLNVSTRSVQDYEAGETVPWKHFQLLEEIFRKPLGWFLHGEEATQPAAEDAVFEGRLERLEGLSHQVLDTVRRIEAHLSPHREEAPDDDPTPPRPIGVQ